MAVHYIFSLLRAFLAASALTLGVAVAMAGQAERIENPPLPARPDAAGWDYMSSYFLQGIYSLIERNEYGNAADQYMTRILETHADEPLVAELAAHVFLRSRNWAGAEAVLDDQLLANPEDAVLLARRGYVREQRGFFNTALRDFRSAGSMTDNPEIKQYLESAEARIAERIPEIGNEESEAWIALQDDIDIARAERDWESIQELTADFLAKWPESSAARLEQAEALAELGRFARARAAIEPVAGYEQDPDILQRANDFLRNVLDPASQRDEWRRADALKARRDLVGYQSQLTAMLRRWPDDTRILAERGFIRFEMGDYEGAERDLALVAERSELDGETRARARTALGNLGRLRERAAAERRASAQREELTKNWDTVVSQQRRIEQTGDLSALEDFYSELIATYPGASYGYIKRAYLRIQLGRPEEARGDFMAALERDVTAQSRMDIQSTVAKIDADRRAADEWTRIQNTEDEFRATEDWAALEAFYDTLIAQRPDGGYAYSARARLRRRQERYDEARDDYEKAIGFENSPAAREALRGELREMLALRRRTYDWDRVYRARDEFQASGDRDGLDEFYTGIIAERPGLSSPYVMRASLRAEMGRLDEAREDYQTALRLAEDPETRYDIQVSLSIMDMDSAVLAAWEEMIATRDRLRERNDVAGLEEFYTQLIEDDSGFQAFGHASRGFLRLAQGYPGEARSDFESAVSLDLDSPLSRDLRTVIAGIDDELRQGGEWSQILRTQEALREQGEWDKLDALYSSLIETRPEYESFAIISRAYLRRQLGRYDEARRDFERALTLDLLEKDRADIRDIIGDLASEEQAGSERRAESARWNEIQRIRQELTDKGDYDALEALYTELIDKGEFLEFARISRGYQYFYSQLYGEAEEDFTAALSLMDDAEARKPYEELLVKISGLRRVQQAERLKAEQQTREWQGVLETQKRLTEREEWAKLEDFFTDLIKNNRYPEYARSSRGYQYFYGKRYDKAQADFKAALALTENPEARGTYEKLLRQIDNLLVVQREEQKREEAAGAAWNAILRTQRELTEAGDFLALEALYDELIADGRYLPFAYSSRGYQHFYANRLEEAKKDFRSAIAASDTDEAAAGYYDMLDAIAVEETRQEYWKGVEERADLLRKMCEFERVIELYDAEAHAHADDAHPVVMRGFAKRDIGYVDAAAEDFELAKTMSPKPDIRGRLDEVLKVYADAAADGKRPGSAIADTVLWRMSQRREERRFEDMLLCLPVFDLLVMTDDQKGRRNFFHAEALWELSKQEEAYPYYSEAARTLEKGWYLSETYGKIAQYHFDRKQPKLAEEYLNLSLSVMPDYVWRHIQAGNMLTNMGRHREAIEHFELALDSGEIKEDDIYFGPNLARSYLVRGNNKKYDEFMRRQIDVYYRKLAATPPGKEWNQLRTDQNRVMLDYESDLQRIKGYQLFFATRNKRGDYMMQYQNDINYGFGRTIGMRFEAYVQMMAPAHNKFSGEYYDSWNNMWFPYESHQYFKDGKALHLGLRWYPFPWLDHNIGIERVFGVGRQVVDDTRLRIRYWKGIGYKYEPIKKHWFYTTVDSDLAWSFNASNLSYRHDRTVGYSFKVADRFVIAPITHALFTFSGRLAKPRDRYGLEAGVGMRFQYLFRGSHYKAPADAIEWSFVYNFGVTKNRPNSLSFSIVHGF